MNSNPTPITPESLVALKALREKAEVETWNHATKSGQIGSVESQNGLVVLQAQMFVNDKADVARREAVADYVAEASNALPSLIAALRERDKELETCRRVMTVANLICRNAPAKKPNHKCDVWDDAEVTLDAGRREATFHIAEMLRRVLPPTPPKDQS